VNILSVSAETHPFSRTGGMGDVCGALPAALAARGHRVVAVSPRYGRENDELAWDTGVEFSFWLFGSYRRVRYFCYEAPGGETHVLVGSPLFERPGIYGDDQGAYRDNLLRFALLCRAALEVPRRVPIAGALLGESFALHAHDWSSSLALLYLAAHYKPLGLYSEVRGVLSVHNAAHHGRYPIDDFGGLELAPRHLQAVDDRGALGCLKAGLWCASDVVAVSPTFARELCTREGGFNMDHWMRVHRDRGHLHGVLNGVDRAAWDPADDEHTAAPFSRGDLAGKAACKAALQSELGLPVRPEAPLLGIVARLDYQKGVDLLVDAAGWLLSQDAQLVVLGTGDPRIAGALRALAARHPHQVAARIDFDGPLSHRIFAGADICLVPSRFEPCGLTQMYGMRYGAVPVVRSTGGLADTVQTWDPKTGEGTGWRFVDATAEGLVRALRFAIRTWYEHPEAFATIRDNGMAQEFSWDAAAARYEAIYAGEG